MRAHFDLFEIQTLGTDTTRDQYILSPILEGGDRKLSLLRTCTLCIKD